MWQDALGLLSQGLFSPDGLTNTAVDKSRQGFSVGDRQTFRNDAWDAKVGDVAARLDFQARMTALRLDLASELGRPTLAPEGVRKQDLDQIYNVAKNKISLSKNTRTNFLKLDKLVYDITSVKSLKGLDELGY